MVDEVAPSGGGVVGVGHVVPLCRVQGGGNRVKHIRDHSVGASPVFPQVKHSARLSLLAKYVSDCSIIKTLPAVGISQNPGPESSNTVGGLEARPARRPPATADNRCLPGLVNGSHRVASTIPTALRHICTIQSTHRVRTATATSVVTRTAPTDRTNIVKDAVFNA